MRLVPPAVALLVALTSVGCAPSTPTQPLPATSSPAPQPTFQCTPEAGGTPAPCSRAEHEAMVKRDAEYAEAERIYRKVFELDEQLYKEGKPASEELLSYMSGEASQQSRDAHADTRYLTGEAQLVWMKRLPNVTKQGATLALSSCIDARSSTVRARGVTEPGLAGIENAYFRLEGDKWKIVLFGYEETTTC